MTMAIKERTQRNGFSLPNTSNRPDVASYGSTAAELRAKRAAEIVQNASLADILLVFLRKMADLPEKERIGILATLIGNFSEDEIQAAMPPDNDALQFSHITHENSPIALDVETGEILFKSHKFNTFGKDLVVILEILKDKKVHNKTDIAYIINPTYDPKLNNQVTQSDINVVEVRVRRIREKLEEVIAKLIKEFYSLLSSPEVIMNNFSQMTVPVIDTLREIGYQFTYISIESFFLLPMSKLFRDKLPNVLEEIILNLYEKVKESKISEETFFDTPLPHIDTENKRSALKFITIREYLKKNNHLTVPPILAQALLAD